MNFGFKSVLEIADCLDKKKVILKGVKIFGHCESCILLNWRLYFNLLFIF